MDRDQVAETLRTVGSAVAYTDVEEAVAPSGARVLGRPVPEEEAAGMWRRLLALRGSTGFHPVLSTRPPSALVDAPSSEPYVFDERAFTAPREVLAEITEAALTDCLRFADEEEAEEWRAEFDPERLARAIAPEPRLPDRRRNYRPSWLCLVESTTGYAVPGLLPGRPNGRNWRHGPNGREMLPSDHVAFLHAWHDRFGAELCYLADSVLMLDVARPPQEPVAVAEAAIEQYAYSPDGRDAISYANRQTRTGHWQFWWD
ncbi:DUF4253 domain-containing protein [Streptomyces aureus]|uniref:DUF4253 domain-containing protein n=1 Tax=Streptomyces aureus TaxID=193461 RepID=UPI0006E32DFE|nr:DUF4253 domain-containing protein [Streptomyces aureus]